jgi:hypothetical protein
MGDELNLTVLMENLKDAGAYGCNCEYVADYYRDIISNMSAGPFIAGILVSLALMYLMDKAYGKGRKIDLHVVSIFRYKGKMTGEIIAQWLIERALGMFFLYNFIFLLNLFIG